MTVKEEGGGGGQKLALWHMWSGRPRLLDSREGGRELRQSKGVTRIENPGYVLAHNLGGTEDE